MNYNYEEEISEDIKSTISHIDFNNVHIVGRYMYEELDSEVVEALILELEANLRFGGNK